MWDRRSEMRYLVLARTSRGHRRISEDELAELVTRDAMVGTAKVSPSGASR